MEECRSLDLRIISTDLKEEIGNFYVSINGDENRKQKTKVEVCGQMKLTVDDAAARENRLTLVVEIVAAGDKPVGEVSVPVKELLDQNKGDEETTVTYAVRLPNGKDEGSLKFSFKFGDKTTVGSSSAHAPVPSPGAPDANPPPGHDDKPKKHGG